MPSHHAPPLSRGTESTGAVRRLVSDARRETRALFREPEAVVRVNTPATADPPPAGLSPHGPGTPLSAASPAAFPADGTTVAGAPRHAAAGGPRNPATGDAPGDRTQESIWRPALRPAGVRPYGLPDASSASRRLGRLLARRLGL